MIPPPGLCHPIAQRFARPVTPVDHLKARHAASLLPVPDLKPVSPISPVRPSAWKGAEKTLQKEKTRSKVWGMLTGRSKKEKLMEGKVMEQKVMEQKVMEQKVEQVAARSPRELPSGSR
jgi:hypothetical protein